MSNNDEIFSEIKNLILQNSHISILQPLSINSESKMEKVITTAKVLSIINLVQKKYEDNKNINFKN